MNRLKNRVMRRYVWVKNTTFGRFIMAFINNYDRHNLGGLSAASTYYLILSIIPFVIFFFNMILFFAHSEFNRVLHVMSLLPKQTQDFMKPIILRLVEGRSETILSIGILVAFWSTAKGVEGLIRALNRILNVNKDEDNIIMVYVKAVIFTFLWTLNALGSLTLLVYGDAIFRYLADYYHFPIEIVSLWTKVVYISPLFVITLSLAIFNRYAPKFRKGTRISWKKAFFSGFIGSILWLLVTYLYRFYIGNMANMSLTYGPLVGLMALFIWMNLSVKAVLFGAEITRALEDIGIFKSRRYLASHSSDKGKMA